MGTTKEGVTVNMFQRARCCLGEMLALESGGHEFHSKIHALKKKQQTKRRQWRLGKPVKDLILKTEKNTWHLKNDTLHHPVDFTDKQFKVFPLFKTGILRLNIIHTQVKKKYTHIQHWETSQENKRNLRNLQCWVKKKKKGFIYSNTKARQQTIAFSAVGWIYFLFKHPAKLILWFKSEMSPNAADLEGLKKGYCIGRVPTLSMAQSICVYTWMD